MVLNEKPTKNWKLRGLKLRGLGQNQISTLRTLNKYYKADVIDNVTNEI